MIVQLAQQLGWIGAALQISPYGEQIVYSEASVVAKDTHPGPSFSITFSFRHLHKEEKPCWLPMFCGAVIAYEFPIPERNTELGLEIPLEVMAAIGGVCHAVEFEGSVVLKGFSLMFVPIKQSEDRIQW